MNMKCLGNRYLPEIVMSIYGNSLMSNNYKSVLFVN